MPMTVTDDAIGDEVTTIVQQFRERTLPAAAWSHRAHLMVGTCYVHELGLDAALAAVRNGILQLNERHGTPNTDSRGYHETITRAHLTLIAAVLADAAPATAFDAVREVLATPLAQSRGLLAYYTESRLMSVAARRGWIEPDLQPLSAPRAAVARRPPGSR